MYKGSDSHKLVRACREAWESSGRSLLLLGVSGGADSTALFLACRLADVPFEVAHCNFNLRGEESLRDRDFVAALCTRHGVVCHIADFKTAEETIKGESVEMACRRLRYDFFQNLKNSRGFSRIVIAHNADDNVETFFLNALRGSGTKGLKAIDRDTGDILRPLLNFRRKEILDFLEAHGQAFIVDSSNLASDHYRRNFLRNEVFPLLESRWEGFYQAVSSTIRLQRHENAIVEFYIHQALKDVGTLLPWKTVNDFPDAETLIFRFIQPFGGTSVMAREMSTDPSRSRAGKSWQLPDGSLVLFTRQGIQIYQPDAIHKSEPSDYVWTHISPDTLKFEDVLSCPLSSIYLPYGEDHYEWKKADTKMKIKSLGLKGSQSVWKVLKDAGFNASDRSRFMVLIDRLSGEPIWLPSIKRSRLHLLSLDSATIFKVSKP